MWQKGLLCSKSPMCILKLGYGACKGAFAFNHIVNSDLSYCFINRVLCSSRPTSHGHETRQGEGCRAMCSRKPGVLNTKTCFFVALVSFKFLGYFRHVELFGEIFVRCWSLYSCFVWRPSRRPSKSCLNQCEAETRTSCAWQILEIVAFHLLLDPFLICGPLLPSAIRQTIESQARCIMTSALGFRPKSWRAEVVCFRNDRQRIPRQVSKMSTVGGSIRNLEQEWTRNAFHIVIRKC